MIDPDKKVDKLNKKRRDLYKNSKHPKPYENEGSEFVSTQPNKKDEENKEKND